MKISKIKIFICILSLIFCVMGCQNTDKPKGIFVNFQKVINGNTIEVLWTKAGVNSLQKIRLMGIDAPDLQQKPWGQQAQKKLKELLSTNPTSLDLLLELESEKPDQYGRFWAFIWYEKKLINEEIIKQGLALVTPCQALFSKPKSSFVKLSEKYCHRLLASQEYARLMELGIWNQNQPMRETPQEFRNHHQSAS